MERYIMFCTSSSNFFFFFFFFGQFSRDLLICLVGSAGEGVRAHWHMYAVLHKTFFLANNTETIER